MLTLRGAGRGTRGTPKATQNQHKQQPEVVEEKTVVEEHKHTDFVSTY